MQGTPVKSCITTRRGELDLLVGLRVRVPVRDRADVVGGDVLAVLVRSRFSRRTFRLKGSLSAPSTASSRKMS